MIKEKRAMLEEEFELGKDYPIIADSKVQAFETFYDLYFNEIPEAYLMYINWDLMMLGWELNSGLEISNLKGTKFYIIRMGK